MQRQVPAVLGLEVPQIQFIDSGWTFLLCLQRRVPTVQTVQMTVEILQVPFLDRLLTARYCATPHAQFTVVTVVDIPVVAQRLSLGPVCSDSQEISLLQYIDQVLDVLVGRSSRFHVCSRGDSRDPTVARVVFVLGQSR